MKPKTRGKYCDLRCENIRRFVCGFKCRKYREYDYIDNSMKLGLDPESNQILRCAECLREKGE